MYRVNIFEFIDNNLPALSFSFVLMSLLVSLYKKNGCSQGYIQAAQSFYIIRIAMCVMKFIIQHGACENHLLNTES